MNWRTHWCWFVFLICLGASDRARAQLDPEKRRLFQFGYDQPLQGRGPLSGYAFYYYNEPGFIRTNLTLRLALAPVYVDSELGIRHALGPNTDLAVGLAGGGFADSYSEIRTGRLFRDESFTGHGGEGAVSIYHRFNPDETIPLTGILRSSVHYTLYDRDDETAPGFTLPGYYFQELSADRFVLLSGQYAVPLGQQKRFGLMFSAATAVVDYLPGLEQPGRWNSGVGAGILFRSKSQAWQLALGYAYGIDAIRDSGRGAHSVGILIQYDLEADRRGKKPFWDPWLNPNKWRGFDWLFGR